MRLPDWDPRLAAYLAGAAGHVSAGALEHCALFAAGGVSAMTGHDPARGFRRRARSGIGRVRILTAAGGLAGLAGERFPEVPILKARRGDIVMTDQGETAALGLCIGGEALFVGAIGEVAQLVRVPRRDWLKAWAV